MNKQVTSALCAILCTFINVSAHAAFTGRLETFPGSGVFQAYYDNQLDITWTADANINSFNTWDNQVAWASSLVIDGVTGWRLPNMDINGDGTIVGEGVFIECGGTQAVCMDNEYGHLYHYGAGTTLGSGITQNSPGPFSNIQHDDYWSGTEFGPNPDRAWVWRFVGGSMDPHLKEEELFHYAWAVRDGDVGAVPIPAAVWLFSSGLIGLLGIARRKRAT